MAASDALYVVEEWVSEHYFTADDASGTFTARAAKLVDRWRSTGAEDDAWLSPRERFTAGRTALVSRLLGLQAEVAALPPNAPVDLRRDRLADGSVAVADTLRYVLGYTDATGSPEQWDVTREGPLHRYAARGVDAAPLVILDALAAPDVEEVVSRTAGHLPEDVILDAGTESERTLGSVAQVLSALSLEPTPPAYMLVLAGRYAVLTSADLWPQGRYLVADLQTVAERADLRAGGEVNRTLVALSADALAPDATSAQWWDETRAEAVANAIGVSEDLRDGVRESIEIIANEVLARRRAQGREDLTADRAQDLALQSLRYLYRILFLLYAEASPELGVLPVGAPEYQAGYSVDRLRDLVQREVRPSSAHGTYLYESLGTLFRLVNTGHRPAGESVGSDGEARFGAGALRFENLEADLFARERTALIDEVGLGNAALQRVLENLLLSRVQKGRNRGFISYVALGINQLGAVYESLMSYTGSIADRQLVEVARNGKPEDGSWVVPADVVDASMDSHRVMVEDEYGERTARTYDRGEFVFRLSGRARQQSASYYSPEVITRFTVSQGLAELLDPVVTNEESLPEGVEVFDAQDVDGNPIRRRRTTAAEVLALTVCEPALGSGAFAIEAVRQLAEEYLTRRQRELGQRIEPEEYAEELQRVKAYIALHNVYGVDLNPTAVELAEVSLWLDTMAPGLRAPWFGLRLRPGNSLIGARHAVYPESAVVSSRPKDLAARAPQRIPMASLLEEPAADGRRGAVSGQVFHFLLPGQGWGAAGQDAEIKKVAPEAALRLREHAKGWFRKLTPAQVKRLAALSQRVEELWVLALRRVTEAERHARRGIPVWGAETTAGGDVTRARIEASLNDPNSAYQRLRTVMDAWCALWFWPVLEDDDVLPPTLEEWWDVVEQLLGRSLPVVPHAGKDAHRPQALGDVTAGWDELDKIELMFSVGGAADPVKLVERTPWLARTREIAREQRFFHWELDFAAVFARGGFDLQVGNPPWVRPDLDVPGLLGEFDPWWVLANKPSETAKKARRVSTLSREGAERSLLLGATEVAANADFLGCSSMYSEVAGTRPDLYRNFMAGTWAHSSDRGVVTLVHPPTHLTDARGYALRRETYRRLRRHWRFINEMRLFREIHHLVEYSINVYSGPGEIDFLSAIALFHPRVAEDSLRHDGSGPEPGFKDADGRWDVTPHRARIQRNRREQAGLWHRLMEGGDPEIPVESSRMLSSINHAAAAALETLSQSSTIGSLHPHFSMGWNETTDRTKGRFESRWGEPATWRDVILQGPSFHVATPFAAERNETMSSNLDYSAVDLEVLPVSARPVTEYKPIYGRSRSASGEQREDTAAYDLAYGSWVVERDAGGTPVRTRPVRDHYRVMWRAMAAGTGERTLIPAIFPPGTASVHSVFAYGFPGISDQTLVLAEASLSSLLSDFMIRSSVGSGIFGQAINRLPRIPPDHPLAPAAALRTLRLNCLTDAYAPLWEECFRDAFRADAWTGGQVRANRPELGDVEATWSRSTPLRIAEDRRRALVEIDAIMAIVTGIPIDDLVTVYRTQFGVLNDYDRGDGKRAYIYDARGRQIPSPVRTAWNKAGRPSAGLPPQDRTAVHPSATGAGRTITYEEPFRILDREADLRAAHAEFLRRTEALR